LKKIAFDVNDLEISFKNNVYQCLFIMVKIMY